MTKGRPKGEKNKYWSAEEKYKVIKSILDYDLTSGEVTRRTGINNGMLSKWVKKYKEYSMEGLKNKRKPSYSYHRINVIIRRETGWIVSDNLTHKICKILNIKSSAKHYKYKKPGEESVKYDNIIRNNWKTKRSFEKIVSDTTSFWFKRKNMIGHFI